MDLKNNQITVGDVLSNPSAKALLRREFPEVTKPVLLGMARGMTLESILRLAKDRYPQEKIDAVLSELQKM